MSCSWRPQALSNLVPFGVICSPAPTSSSSATASKTVTLFPPSAVEISAARPHIPCVYDQYVGSVTWLANRHGNTGSRRPDISIKIDLSNKIHSPMSYATTRFCRLCSPAGLEARLNGAVKIMGHRRSESSRLGFSNGIRCKMLIIELEPRINIALRNSLVWSFHNYSGS